jgi:acetolactate synthase-1/2/3 large subunit
LIYLSEFAISQIRDIEHLVLIGTREPVGFFGYPDIASRLVSDSCTVHSLIPAGVDVEAALEALVDAVGAPPLASEPAGERPEPVGVISLRAPSPKPWPRPCRGRHHR